MPGSWFHDMYRHKIWTRQNSHTHQPTFTGGILNVGHTKIIRYRRLYYLISQIISAGLFFIARKVDHTNHGMDRLEIV